MAQKKYDLAVKVDSYTDREGNSKNKYQNIGAVIEGNNGPYILLERWFNPAGIPNPDDRSNVIVSMFEPKPRDGGGNSGGESRGGGSTGYDDDIPI